jgi:outer membrane receptor protein involved in Fe transport
MNLPTLLKGIIPIVSLGAGVSLVQAQTAPAAPVTQPAQDTVKLDPFNVTADSDVGFVAASSLAGGRIATALKDTPVSYSVITKEFLDAFSITNIAETGMFSVNTDYTPGDQTDYGYAGGANSRVRIRGLSANTPTRNFFPFNAQSQDSFNIDRVDYARGANAILFGNGGAGGTQNTATKQAVLSRDITELRAQVGSWNKWRLSTDVNRPINEKLALRVNAVLGGEDSWRDRLWEDRQGFHLTSTYQLTPKFSIRGEFEYTNVRKTHALQQYNEYISAWDGQTYDFVAPLTGPGAPTTSFLAKAGLERFPGRFVARPDYGGRFLNWENHFRTRGANHNTNAANTNWVNTTKGRVPIRTVGFNLNGQAHRDSVIDRDLIPDETRYALVTAGSPFFRLPTPDDTYLWDDPGHDYPTWTQYTRDYSLYFNYRPFENFFVELAGNINDTPRTGNNSQRRALREFRLDISRHLPDGSPNPWFLHTYHDWAEYLSERNDDYRNIRLQSAYVKETRIGKLQFGLMGGINNEIIVNRSSAILIPADWILPDARGWVQNGEVNEFFPYQRLYTDEANRGWATPYNSLNTKPSLVVDPVTGVQKIVTPYWSYDSRREDNVYDARRDYKFMQIAGNFDLFKNRLVLIGAFRRDFTFFRQTRIQAPGNMPAGWDGLGLALREPAPADYWELTYFPKDAKGNITGPERPADARPRTASVGTNIPQPQYANDRFRDDYNSPDVNVAVNTHTYGGVLNATRWLGLFANRSTTFNFTSPQQDIHNTLVPPTSATSDDYGVRVTLPNNKLAVSITRYRAYQEGATTSISGGFLNNYNAIGDLPPVGDFFNRNKRDFARFRTNNIATTQTNDTRGWEFELTGNPTPNLRIILNGAKTDAAAIDSHVDAVKFMTDNDPLMRQILADGGVLIDPSTNLAFINPALDDPTKINQEKAQDAVDGWNSLVNTTIPQLTALSTLRSRTLGSSEWSGNLAADYRFRSGPLQGLRVGAAINYRGGQVIGSKSGDTIMDPNDPTKAIDDPRVDGSDPIFSPSYYSTRASFSYTVTVGESSRRFMPKTVTFDLTVNNLENRRTPVYGYTTGSQNTSSTVYVPNNGSLSDPSRHAVAGNFFYFDPRSFLLSARLDF